MSETVDSESGIGTTMRIRLFRIAGAGIIALILNACAYSGPTTTAYDGLYEGSATVSDPGLPCQQMGTLNPMKVSGGHIDFGNLRGEVQPNGQVNLVFGQVYVVGQFQGTHFAGKIINPQPACNFNLSMDKVG